MDPKRKGWVRLQDRAGETSSSSNISTSSGGRTPPRKAAKKKPRFESSEVDPPHRQAEQSQHKAKANPKGKGKGKARPPKKTPSSPLAR